ncbi:unnamed protein product [Mytilus edulis]|uniref:Integrase catalytic domain-containing protein n=1 Tax=Mytilus edulis TaxID=6550 RepID=A0A8S3QJ81_MYTED|nr:unnamed protein product [Mytilus edulis]
MEAKTVAEVMLKGWIKRYGCPLELHSDQGRQYESQLFQSICKFLEIDKTRTTPGHPRSDGLVERSNRTIKDMISKYVRTDQRDWDRWIDFVAMAYNSTPHQSTEISPFRMIFGEEMRMPLDVILAEELCENDSELVSEHDHVMKLQDKLKTIHEIARVSLGTAAKRQKRQYDKNVKRMDYSEGDLVRRYQPRTAKGVKKKLSRFWTGPWVIVEKLSNVLYKIKHSPNSTPVIIHADNLKLYKGEKVPKWFKPQKTIVQAEMPNLQAFEDMRQNNMEREKDAENEIISDTTQHLNDTDTSEQSFTPPVITPNNFPESSNEAPPVTPSGTPPVIYRTRTSSSSRKKELLVKIPEYSDISDDEIEWDDNNNITSDYNFPDRNANGDATTYEADNYVTLEKENFNLDGFCVVDDDFLDITEEEFTDMKSNLVVEEDVKTVTLTLIKTEQKFLDGSVKVKKETCIGYTENVDKNKLNVPDIVTEVTNLINDVVDSNNNVPEMFYNL